MKVPKSRNKYCPTCKKHTEHKVFANKGKTPFSAHPLSAGNKDLRAKWRGRIGFGNSGKYSKPPISKWKMAGKKTSKKTDLRYECTACKKIHVPSTEGTRARKLELV